MPFSHNAKIKHNLVQQAPGWIIRRIEEPTTAMNFRGKTVSLTHYYRIYNSLGEPIKYCKFQQIERLASILDMPFEALPLVD